MTKLDGVSAGRLRSRLSRADDPKAVKRLMIALAYVDGESVSALSRRYGIPASTIYYWLDRLEERPLDEAVADDSRPGRPRELTEEERDRLASDLRDPPGEHGYDAAEWTSALVREHVDREFDVEYSPGHVRRLLRTDLAPAG